MSPDEARAFCAVYTEEVLGWKLGASEVRALPAEDPAQARRAAERALRMHAAGGRERMILLGLGDGGLARLLRAALPENALLILETDMECARGAAGVSGKPGGAPLLTDTSPWALLLLARAAGFIPERCTLCRNPALAGKNRETLLAWERLFTASTMQTPPQIQPARVPSLSVACMLHPEEPDLEDFFARMPPWLNEVCVLWDGESVPAAMDCPAPLRAACRPLNAHFGEQRNTVLALCRSEWCLCLDADERLEARSWDALRRLLAVPELGGVLFPRLTFEGDAEHARVGYGLWPDMQLRLFRVTPGVRFEGAVHERVTGLAGRLGTAADIPLLHYSHVRKSAESLARRLAVFNQAAGEELHRLNAGYPRLPLAFLQKTQDALAGYLLMLPVASG